MDKPQRLCMFRHMQRVMWLGALAILSCSADKFSSEMDPTMMAPTGGAGGSSGPNDPSVAIDTLDPSVVGTDADAGVGGQAGQMNAEGGAGGDSSAGAGGGLELGGAGGQTECTDGACLCPDGQAVCAATCPGCFIGNECIGAGTANPQNECEVCDPIVDSEGWAAREGMPCDDGQYCTINDACNGNSCSGTPRECDDGVACNGIAACDEGTDSCTPGQNQCGVDLCDVALDQCVSSCTGCLISGQCVPAGAEDPGNPCMVCDPNRSDSNYSAQAGKNCGQGPTECSGQDTCNAQGQCQPNHNPPGSTCGNSSTSACDAADTCNGSGQCQTNSSSNGDACDDGEYCTTSSQCQGGQCVSTGTRNCGANQTCDEQANSCVCTGCQIGQSCVANGTLNPSNPCQICSVANSTNSYSANFGVSCGSGPQECSNQDTCNAQGVCQPNHVNNGTLCNNGTCQAGICEPDPFDCVAPDPPVVAFPDAYLGSAPPPVGQGGNVRDGRYYPVRLDQYGDNVTITLRTFEFRANYVQVGQRPYSSVGGPYIPEIQFAGTYSTSGNSMTFDAERCDPNYNIDVGTFTYTATPNGLVTIEEYSTGTTIVTTLARE